MQCSPRAENESQRTLRKVWGNSALPAKSSSGREQNLGAWGGFDMKGWAHGIQGRGEEQGLGVGGQGELSLLAAPTVSRSWNALSTYKIPPVSSHRHSEVTFWCSRLPKSASLPSKLSSFHFHLGTLSPRAMLMPTLSSGRSSFPQLLPHSQSGLRLGSVV